MYSVASFKVQTMTLVTSHFSTSAIRHHSLAAKKWSTIIVFAFSHQCVSSQFSGLLLWKFTVVSFIVSTEKPGLIGRLRLWWGKQIGGNSASEFTVSHDVSRVWERFHENWFWLHTYRWGFQEGKRERKVVENGGHSVLIWNFNLEIKTCTTFLLGWPGLRSGDICCLEP